MRYGQESTAFPKAHCAPTLAQQTGWQRPHPKALCQDIKILQKVTECDFDLSDPGFQRYATMRGVLYLAGVKGSPRWRFTDDFSKGREEFMRDAYFNFAQEYPAGSGVRHKYTPDEMEFHWKTMILARGRLQDAWELYRTRQP